MILDIGSGINKFHRHLKGENVIHFDISKKAFGLNVNGDAHFLPFKDKSFDFVVLSHVLEHCYNPFNVLNEVKRVSKDKILIVVPNCGYWKGLPEDTTHLFTWSHFSFFQLLSKVFNFVDVKTLYEFKQTEYIRNCGFIKRVYYLFKLRLFTTLNKQGNSLYGYCKN